MEQMRPAGDISIGIPTPPSCDLDRDLIGTKPVLKCSAWTGVQQNPACGGSNGLACSATCRPHRVAQSGRNRLGAGGRLAVSSLASVPVSLTPP